MTVSYNLDVSKKSWYNAFKILFRWRGSIWRLVWKELFIWLFVYYTVMIIYRTDWILSPEGKRIFEGVAHHIDKRIDFIPLTFILAFFVTIVLGRWARIIDNMGYIENAAFTIATTVRGTVRRDIMAKRSMVRYLCLSQVLVFRDISVRVRRRFPTLEAIVQAGFLEEDEKETFEGLEVDSPNKYWVPINWACALAYRLKESGNLVSETPLMNIVSEIKNFRTNLQTLCCFDWVPVPVAYPQVVYFSVYIYFTLALISRQSIIGSQAVNKDPLDIAFPFMTVLQFTFYVGWMKVAETLLNPMGEDDDHFECNSLIDKNIATALAIVDDTFDHVPNLKMDRFKTQEGPLYPDNAVPKKMSYCPQFTGSAALMFMAPEDEQVHMVPMKSDGDSDVDTEAEGTLNKMKQRIRRLSDTSGFAGFAGRARRASTAPTHGFASKKPSVFTKTDDDVENPPSYTQSSAAPNGLHTGTHPNRADHLIRVPSLDEIVEEEDGGLSRHASVDDSGDMQAGHQNAAFVADIIDRLSPVSESSTATVASSDALKESSVYKSTQDDEGSKKRGSL